MPWFLGRGVLCTGRLLGGVECSRETQHYSQDSREETQTHGPNGAPSLDEDGVPSR